MTNISLSDICTPLKEFEKEGNEKCTDVCTGTFSGLKTVPRFFWALETLNAGEKR